MNNRTDPLARLTRVTGIRHRRAYHNLIRAAGEARLANEEAHALEVNAKECVTEGISDINKARLTFLSRNMSRDAPNHVRATVDTVRARIQTAKERANAAAKKAQDLEVHRREMARVLQLWEVRKNAIERRHSNALLNEIERRERKVLDEHVDSTSTARAVGRRN